MLKFKYPHTHTQTHTHKRTTVFWWCFSLWCVCVSTHVCVRSWSCPHACVCLRGRRRACLSTCMCMYFLRFRSSANRWREDDHVGHRGDGHRCRGSKPGPCSGGVEREQRGDWSGRHPQHHWAESRRKQSKLLYCVFLFFRYGMARRPIQRSWRNRWVRGNGPFTDLKEIHLGLEITTRMFIQKQPVVFGLCHTPPNSVDVCVCESSSCWRFDTLSLAVCSLAYQDWNTVRAPRTPSSSCQGWWDLLIAGVRLYLWWGQQWEGGCLLFTLFFCFFTLGSGSIWQQFINSLIEIFLSEGSSSWRNGIL